MSLPISEGQKFTLHFLRSVSRHKYPSLDLKALEKYIDSFIADGSIEPSGGVGLTGEIMGWVCIRRLTVTI